MNDENDRVVRAEQVEVLEQVFSANRVVTTAQLRRWGLWDAAIELGVLSRVQTVRTQVTQTTSLRDLEFVAMEHGWLSRPERELKHWSGLAEVWWSVSLGRRGVWKVLDGRGRAGRRMPDAQVTGLWLDPWAIEIDCGYGMTHIRDKLVGMAEAGFRRVVWATTVHDRVRRVGWLIDDLWRAGELSTVEEYDVRFCNFWSREDPYRNRPRCFKRNQFVGERQVILAVDSGDGPDDVAWDGGDSAAYDGWTEDGEGWSGGDVEASVLESDAEM
ncbi:hypothetical protein GCM10017781_41530 [Deinococcus metalli]|nr:hypothetical protein GCM10017781_41530 [Deinococcus metalli]